MPGARPCLVQVGLRHPGRLRSSPLLRAWTPASGAAVPDLPFVSGRLRHKQSAPPTPAATAAIIRAAGGWWLQWRSPCEGADRVVRRAAVAGAASAGQAVRRRISVAHWPVRRRHVARRTVWRERLVAPRGVAHSERLRLESSPARLPRAVAAGGGGGECLWRSRRLTKEGRARHVLRQVSKPQQWRGSKPCWRTQPDLNEAATGSGAVAVRRRGAPLREPRSGMRLQAHPVSHCHSPPPPPVDTARGTAAIIRAAWRVMICSGDRRVKAAIMFH
jgi:hypothetical protein